MQKCIYNEPDVFDPEMGKKLAEIRKLTVSIEKDRKIMTSKKYGGKHPHDIALEIQKAQLQIGILRNEIRPKVVA